MRRIACITAISFFVIACTNTEKKDSVEIADSINKARIDTAVNTNKTTVDENSALFLVDAANSGMAEVDLGALATQKASSQRVKEFASMMVSDHSAVNEQVKGLASQKNVTLPDSMSAEKRKGIDDLKNKNKTAFDKAFIELMVKDH
jgi:putative membrane protein